jgi:hypothetical protein
MSIIGVSGQSPNPYLLWQLQNATSSQPVGNTDSDGDSGGTGSVPAASDPATSQNSFPTGQKVNALA